MQANNDYFASVKPSARASYEASFKWHQTYQLSQSKEGAVQVMLNKTGLIPKACTKGIKYIRGGETEGGWGWAEFVCR